MHRPSLPNAPAGSGQLQALRAGAEEVAGDVEDVAEEGLRAADAPNKKE
jgi:hypothetical protein